MKNLILAFAVALGLSATPALAQSANSNFVGPRIEATIGAGDFSNINYGAAVGVDIPLGTRLTLGAEANLDNVLNREDFGIAGRMGVALNQNLLVYGTAGYASFRNLDGLRVGGGIELSSGSPLYAKAEYRYQTGIGRHSGLVGVGLRF